MDQTDLFVNLTGETSVRVFFGRRRKVQMSVVVCLVFFKPVISVYFQEQ